MDVSGRRVCASRNPQDMAHSRAAPPSRLRSFTHLAMSLLEAQGDQGIDARGTPRGDIAGQQGYGRQQREMEM